MKQTLKVFVLGCMTIGALAGCEWGTSSKSQESTDSHSSEITSTLPTSSSDSTPTTTSSFDSSNSSVSTSSTSSTSTTTSVAPVLTGITLNAENVKKSYILGEALDLTGLVVTANYSDGNNVAVTDYTANPANGAQLNVGDNEITITYQSASAKFNVLVKQAQSIVLNTTNVKTVYEQGEALDLTGLVVTVIYSDNTSAVVTDYITDPANGTVLTEIGTFKVKVTVNTIFQSYDITVNKAVKRDWTNEEAQIMKDHLYDVVLPYTGFEESVVTWSAQYETLYIKGGAANDDDLLAYARALSSLGFVLTSQTSYSFRKVINTTNGDRYVRVTYYIDEDNAFYLEAYDPYYYEFPTQVALYFAYTNFGSTQTPPAFAADRYEISTQNTAIYCYKDSVTAVADYTSTLNTALWDTTGGYDAVQGFYTAISPDKAYMIYYNYDTNYKSLDIYFAPVNFFNDAPIKAFYAKYTNYTIDIPAIEVEGASYYFYESEFNADYAASGNIGYVHAYLSVIGGTRADAVAYAKVLEEAGWTVNGGEEEDADAASYVAKIQIEELGLARIEVIYNNHDGFYLIFYAGLDPLPGTYWPEQEIANGLGYGINDTVPAYTGAAKHYTYFEPDMWSDGYVVISVEEGTEQDCIDAYKRTLVENDFTTTTGGNFISKNHQIRVSVYTAEAGTFTVEFFAGPFLQWPAERIQRLIDDLYPYEITDILPAFEGGEEYTTELYEDDGLYISISFENKEAEEAVDEYTSILGINGFELLGEDADGDYHYISPNQQFTVCPYVSMGDFYIYIPEYVDDSDPWPQDDIDAWMERKGFTDELPEYEGDYASAVVDEDYPQISVIITLDNPSEEDIQSAFDSYCYTLYLAGFEHTYSYPSGFGEEYTSPNEQFTVTVCMNDNGDGIELVLDEAAKEEIPTDGFPLADFLTYFPTATDLPVITDEDVAYEFGGYEGCAYVYVTYATEELTEAAVTAYESALAEAGYTPQEVWGGYAIAYMSKDGTFGVVVDYYGTDMSITLYCLDYLIY